MMTQTANAPPVLRDAKQASKFLAENGHQVSAATIETKRSRGAGPPATKVGRRVLYEESALLAWARGRHVSQMVSLASVAFQATPAASKKERPVSAKEVGRIKKEVDDWERDSAKVSSFVASRFDDAQRLARKPGDDRIAKDLRVSAVAIAMEEA
jgi:hypothetical protein